MNEDAGLLQIAKRYKKLASGAETTAASMGPSRYRECYFKIARHCSELAREIEEMLSTEPRHEFERVPSVSRCSVH